MAQTIAPADPITLAAAFSDQAHRTDDSCRASSRFKPEGNGIPIANPAGKINSTAVAIFNHWGHPTPPATSGETTAATAPTRATTATSAIDSFAPDCPTSLRLQKLPKPL